MKLINQSATLVVEDNPLKLVELAGRVSHKSEDRITNDSYKSFLISMLKLGHTATLEFASVYLEFDSWSAFTSNYDIDFNDLYNKHPAYHFEFSSKIYTNLRWVLNNSPKLFIDYINNNLQYCNTFIPKDNDPYKRYCFNIVCNRGVSHELVRHRVFSFLQESTRYCNYSKDKFSNELNIINPFNNFIKTTDAVGFHYNETLELLEQDYASLIKAGLKAQEARGILPNDLKTELYMSGFLKDWVGHNVENTIYEIYGEEVKVTNRLGFDTLRNDKSAHPQAREIAEQIKVQLIETIGEDNWNTIKENYYE